MQLPQVETPPTRLRHLVVFISVLMSVMLYLDRTCVSIAGNYIREDLGLNASQMDLFFSAFFWTYALGQVPAGWLSDRFGARAMLTAYILSWSVFTAAIGLAYGFVVLLVMRAAFGFAQAGAYPTSGSLLSKWIPFSNRGTASSLVAFGGRVGGVAAPLLTAYLIVLFVPLSVSSLVRDGELLNGPRLCRELQQAASNLARLEDGSQKKAAARVAARVMELLPEEARARVERLAAAQEAWDLQDQQRQSVNGPGALAPAVPIVAPEDRTALIESLNSVIRMPDFSVPDFSRPAFGGQLGFSREATAIAAIPAADRKSPETERLNRLILETAFSRELGKIYVLGWRPVMWVYGLAGCLVALQFYVLFRNRPEEHAFCNKAERALIRSGEPEATAAEQSPPSPFPWNALLRSPSMWLMCISQFGTNVGWVFLITLLPQYLENVHHVPLDQRGEMQSLILFVGIGGMLIGGRLTDFLTRLVGLRWGRGIPLALPKAFCTLAFLVSLKLDDAWQIAACLAMVAFFTDLGIGASWAYMQDVGGQYVGAMLGWANMWGNFGAAVAPLMFGVARNVDSKSGSNWNAVFLVCAAAFVVSGVTALGIDSRKPIGPQAGS